MTAGSQQFELNLFFLLLHNAGSETTRNLLTGGLLALLQHPDQLALLQEDPSRIPTAIEELLRFVTPVTHFARTVKADTEVAGQQVRAGERVVLWYTAANRDPGGLQPTPIALDVTRDPNPHVAFGAGGPHFCLGAHLARLEAREMFAALLPYVPCAGSGRPGRAAAVLLHQWHQAHAIALDVKARKAAFE